MADVEDRKILKDKYIKIIESLGYKIMFDLDEELSNDIYDIYMLCTRSVDTESGILRKRYVFLVIPYTSNLSLKSFRDYLPNGDKAKDYDKFVKGLHNYMLEYTIDDVVAILLHVGFNIENFYQFIKGKPRLKLNREMISILVNEGNMKGSPLNITEKSSRSITQHKYLDDNGKPAWTIS